MTSNAHELGASVGAWNAVIRRARIGRERKAAALVVSSYARADGTRIHCGVARLAVDLEVSYSTAKRNLAWLRNAGLIELVRAGNRRRNLSDEYRLILGPDVAEAIEIIDPAEHKRLTDGLRVANRSGDRGSSKVTPDEPVDNPGSGVIQGDPQSAQVVQEPRVIQGDPQNEDHGSPMGEPPSTRKIFLPVTTDEEDLGERLTLRGSEVREGHAAVVEIFPGASSRLPYVAPRKVGRADQAIAEATARREAARRAHHKEAQ